MTTVSKPPSWKEAGEKLKEAVASEEKSLTTEQVRGIEVTKNVAQFFKDNAEVGTKHVSDSGAFFPYLKIGEANSQNELADGSFAKPGYFYYAPTKEQFEEVSVSIVNISNSFYIKNEPKEPTDDRRKYRKFVQFVGGVITANNLPFVMMIYGTRLNGLWQFGRDIKKYTKSKVEPIPMFALKVQLTLKLAKTAFGMNYLVNYKVRTDAAGLPMFVQDEGNLQFLLDLSKELDAKFKEYEEKFSIDPDTLKPRGGGPVEVTTVTPSEKVVLDAAEAVEALPFE